MSLGQDHLVARGINDDTIQKHDLELDTFILAPKVMERLRRKPFKKSIREIIWFPQYDAQGRISDWISRPLPDPPETPHKKQSKFVCRTGSNGAPYIPRTTYGLKKGKPVIITEGPVKALICDQCGVAAIGLSGVDCVGIKTDEGIRIRRDILEALEWEGRIVYFAFDADLATNPKVRRALVRAFLLFSTIGAKVQLLSWPLPEGKGIDDYLVAARQRNGQKPPEEILAALITNAKAFITILEPIPSDLGIVVTALEKVWLPEVLRSQLCKQLGPAVGVDPQELKARTKKSADKRKASQLADAQKEHASEIATTFPAYYDVGRKEFIVQIPGGTYQTRTDSGFKRDLRFSGINERPVPGELYSPADMVLREIQHNHYVRYVGPLAGYRAGSYRINNEPVLVTTNPVLIEPAPGPFPLITKLLTNLLGDKQFVYFYGWLKIAFETLRRGERRKGQAVFLCGEKDSGKSFLQHYIITPLLGGRCAFPYKYLNGDTQFNAELFGAEHLVLEDDVPFTDYRARRRFGTYIKSVTANDPGPCYTKYQTPVTLNPFWRLTVSTNDEPENLMIIPVLDVSLIDKVMLFKTEKKEMPMPTGTDSEREAFRWAIADELPALAYALMLYEIPPELRLGRYGIASYQNPQILELVNELQPENKLLELIDLEIFKFPLPQWEGYASALETKLRDSILGGVKEQAGKLFYSGNICGILLSRLARQANPRVQVTNRGNSSFYRITRPPRPPVFDPIKS